MKQFILKLPSYIFHPIWLSTFTLIYYFFNANFMHSYESMLGKLLAIILLTVIIPIFFLILLKPLKLISNFHLSDSQERKIPLLFFTTLSAIITNYIFDPINYRILFYFFSGVFFCGLVSFLLTFFNHKTSLHAMGGSTLVSFIILFNFYFNLNQIILISFSIICLGWISTSRLYMMAHNWKELLTGIIIGTTSQVVFSYFWTQ